MADDTIAYMGWGLSAQEQIDGFRREVRELKAENALLWEQGARLFDKTLELGTENAKLRELGEQYETVLADYRSEVIKLRELVEDMLDCIDIQIAFERVPARWMQDEFAGRARDLGVEVD